MRKRPLSETAISPLRHKLYRSVWLANVASNFGLHIQLVGASWVMATISRSEEMVALVTTANAVPIMLLSLLAGAIADNYSRRTIMLGAQAFMLVASSIMAILAFESVLSPATILFLTFLISCGTAFNGPSWQSSVGEMVPREDLTRAVTLNALGYNVARSAGPGVGGVIVGALGASVAFAANALSYIGLIIILLRWRPTPERRLLPPEPLAAAIGDGLRYALMSSSLRAILARGTIFGAASAALQALIPLVARDLIKGGPLVYGLLLGAFGVGAVVGGLAGHSLRSRWTNETLARASSVIFGVMSVVIGLSRSLPLTVPAILFAGAAWILLFSSMNATVQLTTPRWVVGRALAISRTGMFGGLALGSWLWGYLAVHHGVGATLCISFIAHLLCTMTGLLLPLPRDDQFDLTPLERAHPTSRLALDPRRGPVIISIAYRIAEQDIAEFVALMSARRRGRLRDGARRWSLLQDLETPDLWLERYQTRNWTAYLRHKDRRTNDDDIISARLRALHQDGAPPVVTRMVAHRP